MKNNLICPNTKICKIYKEYIKNSHPKTLGIIVKHDLREYICMALRYGYQKQGETIKPEKDKECTLVELLNNQELILNKLKGLPNKL